MTMMTISQESYRSRKSPDNKFLADVSRTHIFVYDISGIAPILIDQIFFQNPNQVCFSPSNQLLGVRSTSGRLLVYSLLTHETVFLQKRTRTSEGSDLYFLDENTLFFSDWDGKIYIFSVPSAKLTLLHHFQENDMRTPVILANGDKEWIMFGSVPMNNDEKIETEIYRLSLSSGLNHQYLARVPFNADIFLSSKYRNKVYFSGSIEENENLYVYDIDKNTFENFISLHHESGYLTDICVSDDGRYLGIVFCDELQVYETFTKKCIFSFREKYLSNMQFISLHTIWVGSWNKIHILNLPV